MSRSPQKRAEMLGTVFVLLGALAIGLMPSAAKIAYQEGANPLAAIILRSVIGIIGVSIYLLIRRQSFGFSHAALNAGIVVGIAQAFNSLGIMASVAYIDVSVAIVIISCFPFWVAIYNHLTGASRLTLPMLICFFLALAGLVLLVGFNLDTINPTGLYLAIMGMFAMAVMVLVVSSLSSQIGPVAANLHMTGWTTIYFLLIAFLIPQTGWIDAPMMPDSSKGWVAILATGISFTFGYILFFVGAGYIGTTKASMLSISEPALIVLVAVMLLDEWLEPIQWLGLSLVIASLMVIAWPTKAKKSTA